MSFVKSERNGHVTTLTISRPEALNALNSQVLSDLEDAIIEVERDSESYAVIITGDGRAFVAGADIAEMRGFEADIF